MRMTVSRDHGGTWFPHPPARRRVWEGCARPDPPAGGGGDYGPNNCATGTGKAAMTREGSRAWPRNTPCER